MSDPHCNFYIGQKIMLKEAHPSWTGTASYLGHEIRGPVLNVVYTVRAFQDDHITRCIGVLLVEIINQPMPFVDGFKEAAWRHTMFRPVTDISSLEKLLASKPIKERVE